jgi:hypothetical protein
MQTSIDNPTPKPRIDLYLGVHKGLRAFMTNTLERLGRMDPNDAEDVGPAAEQLRELLFICGTHLHHENAFVHPAMEARRPGASARIAHEHTQHEQALAALQVRLDELLAATEPDAREAAGVALYRHLAVFIAENFEHMQEEESANNRVLQEAFSDEELIALHDALLASIPPAEMAVYLRWILPSISHAERVAMLDDMRQKAPTEAFEGVLAMARMHLSGRDWSKLSRALKCPVLVA